MKNVKITVLKKAFYKDLALKYENPIEHDCNIKVGDIWIVKNGEKPIGFCDSAWENLSKYVFALSCGGTNFFDGWMKNPNSAIISCNDGIRPVSFLLEVIGE